MLMSKETLAPNERLRRARNLKGWSQADLAAELGTSFEMVSRWERGVTIPSPYYRQRLCAALGQSIEDLGLLETSSRSITAPSLSSSAAAAPVSHPPRVPNRLQWRGMTRPKAVLLLVLVALVLVGAVLGSASVLAHLGRTSAFAPVNAARGGTWIEDLPQDPGTLIPGLNPHGALIEQALYLPLFYGDARGLVHPGAATEVPTLENGGVTPDAKTWTFHLRPHLVWSDGQPYDARDVDFTWKRWLSFWSTSPFGDPFDGGLTLIRSADVSADHLSITFQLMQPYAAFLQYWIGGYFAPLPAHDQKGNAVNPAVTSGPFLLAESVPGDHYTLVRNPRYYLTSTGHPYLDRLVFRITDQDTILKDLRAGTITSTSDLDLGQLPVYRQLTNYQLVSPPTSASFEALSFNFHNVILSSHLEVRQAMAMAIDRQTLVDVARQGFASPLCTDHPSAMHPGYEPESAQGSRCPQFDLLAANKLLDSYGWVKGADGVRAKDGQRLEFEYSAPSNVAWRNATEAIIQRDFLAIGIKLDIQNYEERILYGSLMLAGNPSPPTGAVAGRYDIAEFGWLYGYDPDDYFLFACDEIPPNGPNTTFFCDPALDSLFLKERTTVDPEGRQGIFESIHSIYLEDLAFIVLYSPTDVSIARKGTHNYLPGPIDGSTSNNWDWWCDHGQCQGTSAAQAEENRGSPRLA
jgi:peptide/nickel transport system substrate-binding protein